MIYFPATVLHTINSFSSQDVDWPASNVDSFEKRGRFWKPGVTTNSWIIFDFGSAVAINAFALINVNFTNFNLQAHTTTNFATPDYNQALTVGVDKFTGKRRRFFQPSFTKRYARLFIPSQATTDGDTTFKVGGVIFSSSFDRMLVNPDYGFRISENQSVELIELMNGGQEMIKRGEKYISITFNRSVDRSNQAEFDQTMDRFFNVDFTSPHIFAFESGEIRETATPEYYVYVVKRTSGISYVISGFGVADIEGVVLREQV